MWSSRHSCGDKNASAKLRDKFYMQTGSHIQHSQTQTHTRINLMMTRLNTCRRNWYAGTGSLCLLGRGHNLIRTEINHIHIQMKANRLVLCQGKTCQPKSQHRITGRKSRNTFDFKVNVFLDKNDTLNNSSPVSPSRSIKMRSLIIFVLMTSYS